MANSVFIVMQMLFRKERGLSSECQLYISFQNYAFGSSFPCEIAFRELMSCFIKPLTSKKKKKTEEKIPSARANRVALNTLGRNSQKYVYFRGRCGGYIFISISRVQ